MWNMAQKGNDIAKSKSTSRMACAAACHANAECVGFEFHVSTKDCHLTKTSWRQFVPTGSSNWWVCEKKDGK